MPAGHSYATAGFHRTAVPKGRREEVLGSRTWDSEQKANSPSLESLSVHRVTKFIPTDTQVMPSTPFARALHYE